MCPLDFFFSFELSALAAQSAKRQKVYIHTNFGHRLKYLLTPYLYQLYHGHLTRKRGWKTRTINVEEDSKTGIISRNS